MPQCRGNVKSIVQASNKKVCYNPTAIENIKRKSLKKWSYFAAFKKLFTKQ